MLFIMSSDIRASSSTKRTIKMTYIITNGTEFLKKGTNPPFYLTKDICEAARFEEYVEARRALNEGTKYLKLNKFFLKPFNDKLNNTEAERALLSPVAYPVMDPEWLEDLKNSLVFVDSTIGQLADKYSDLCEKLNDINNEIEDIKHAIEFTNLNAADGCCIEKELREALRKRRAYKNARYLIRQVMGFGSDDWGKNKVRKVLDEMEGCVYIPRKRRDLFERKSKCV